MPEPAYRQLNVLMSKPEAFHHSFNQFLTLGSECVEYQLDSNLDIDGTLYVKRTVEKRPKWAPLVDTITGANVEEIGTKSSSAVLLIRAGLNVFAITFGYGRFLVDTTLFVPDFGIRTALNTLNHKSLRSIDIHTLDDKPVQKKITGSKRV